MKDKEKGIRAGQAKVRRSRSEDNAVLPILYRAIVPLVAVIAMTVAMELPLPAIAQTTGSIERGPSGLPLPRFASLKASRVNLRIGPGQDYGVSWLYLRKGLPLEIIQEYDNWRRVRDADGTEGWIYQSLLSGSRTGMAAPWLREKSANVALHSDPKRDSRTIALVEPGAIGEILSCNGTWCHVRFGGYDGWTEQGQIWGISPGETYKK